MYYYTADWQLVAEPDFDKYKVELKTAQISAAYELTKEEVSHYEPTMYYLTMPDGTQETVDATTVDEEPEYTTGSEVKLVVDTPAEGHWRYERDGQEWQDCPDLAQDWWSKAEPYDVPFEYCLLTPYTADELQERQEQKEREEQERQEQELLSAQLQSTPDALAELSELVSDSADSTASLADAIAELSQLVSDLVEGTE